MSEKDFLCKLDDLITNGTYGKMINDPVFFSQFLVTCCLESESFFNGLKSMNYELVSSCPFLVAENVSDMSLLDLIDCSSKDFINSLVEFNEAVTRYENRGLIYSFFRKQCFLDSKIIDGFSKKKTDYVKLVVPKAVNYFFASFSKKAKESLVKENNNQGLSEFKLFGEFKKLHSVDASYMVTGLLTGSLCNGYLLEKKDDNIILSQLPSSVYTSFKCYNKAVGGLFLNSGNFPESWAYEACKKQRVWKGAFTAW